MSRSISYICLLFSILSIFGCKSTTKQTPNCTYLGKVIDYSQLDGCKLMIEMDNGIQLQPVNTKLENFDLQAGQNITFSYKELEDVASICMSGDKIVEITCAEIVQTSSSEVEVRDCINTANPINIDWMKKAITANPTTQVVKYPFREYAWAYLFIGKSKCFMYSCRGQKICETKDLNTAPCLAMIDSGAKGEVIWQGEGPKE